MQEAVHAAASLGAGIDLVHGVDAERAQAPRRDLDRPPADTALAQPRA
jgi:hypothetical protein